MDVTQDLKWCAAWRSTHTLLGSSFRSTHYTASRRMRIVSLSP